MVQNNQSAFTAADCHKQYNRTSFSDTLYTEPTVLLIILFIFNIENVLRTKLQAP